MASTLTQNHKSRCYVSNAQTTEHAIPPTHDILCPTEIPNLEFEMPTGKRAVNKERVGGSANGIVA